MSKAYRYIASMSELLPELPEESILSRTVHSDEEVNVTLFGFAAGQELTEHTAAFPALLHFLEGEFTLRLGEDQMQAGLGAWAYMPAHLPHSVRAETAGSLLLVLIKASAS
ncbi:MAG: cupin domain-containing protein [Anaerolineales bacterium]|jgi:quercetin dioxygenase-like cupin family protein